jgi:hypothetical protein
MADKSGSPMKPIHVFLIAVLLIPRNLLLSQGNVYLVLGSDTGIWVGMNVDTCHCTYALTLFTDPAGNASRVMFAGTSVRPAKEPEKWFSFWGDCSVGYPIGFPRPPLTHMQNPLHSY